MLFVIPVDKDGLSGPGAGMKVAKVSSLRFDTNFLIMSVGQKQKVQFVIGQDSSGLVYRSLMHFLGNVTFSLSDIHAR